MEVTTEIIQDAVARYATVRGQGTLANLLAFGRVLKQLGIEIGMSQMIDASRSLGFVNLSSKTDFRVALRANLVSDKDDMALFERAFECFWQDCAPEPPAVDVVTPPIMPAERDGWTDGDAGNMEELLAQGPSPEAQPEPDQEPFSVPTYSPNEVLSRKDFSEMGIEESRAVAQAILMIANKIATQVSRRKKRATKGDGIDPRWTMRKSIKYGGEIVELVERKRRIRKTRVVLLCDVSGSMDCYSRFLIQFMYGLQNELWGVETFVFSTSLSRITHLIRSKDIAGALERISNSVLGWSGGTNIGRSLQTFNQDFAAALVSHRTVVVIISDGWDRGDVRVLGREMQRLKARCRTIIWLNPLLASDHYEPLCKGMQAALPYLDYFLSVHSVNSLVALGRTLQRLVA
ncbi:MAG: VWA domain-containing protein [Deltaproteobacteria bacterium]|nr:VWA domain-containing protein [Deltaproteobacteria bacterium]